MILPVVRGRPDSPGVDAGFGKIETRRMPQHVRVNREFEAAFRTRSIHDLAHGRIG